MSAAQIANDKATFTRRYDALNSGAVRLVSKMIDELFDSDVRLGTPLPVRSWMIWRTRSPLMR